jgi:hypothetical protein
MVLIVYHVTVIERSWGNLCFTALCVEKKGIILIKRLIPQFESDTTSERLFLGTLPLNR